MRTIPEEQTLRQEGDQHFMQSVTERRLGTDCMERAMHHARNDRHEDAAKEYDEAVVHFRTSATHLNNLADVLERLRKEMQ